MPATQFELLAEELGAISGRFERETRLRVDLAVAECHRRDAERELRFSKLERAIEERLASVKDGVIGERGPEGSQGPQGDRGEKGDQGDVGPVGPQGLTGESGIQGLQGDRGEMGPGGPIGESGPLGLSGPEGPRGIDGSQGERGEVGPHGERGAQGDRGEGGEPGPIGLQGERGSQGDRGEVGPQGLMPSARAWEDRVHYEGNAVTHGGALYQAARDTAKEPPHGDWICLAAAGKDGADGRSFAIRNTFAQGERYAMLDVVSLNGASFAARRDNPGPCPGDGWQLIAKQGDRGKPGDPGRQGGKGEPGPKVQSMSSDGEGLLTLRHEDGSEVACDLYPLLAKLK